MDNATFAAGLRELADLYERHPEMIRPWDDRIDLHLSAKPDGFREMVKSLADGGTVEKVERKKDDWFYHVRRTMPSGVVIEVSVDRSSVCRKVRKLEYVDTWECPDSILNPEAA